MGRRAREGSVLKLGFSVAFGVSTFHTNYNHTNTVKQPRFSITINFNPPRLHFPAILASDSGSHSAICAYRDVSRSVRPLQSAGGTGRPAPPPEAKPTGRQTAPRPTRTYMCSISPLRARVTSLLLSFFLVF